MVMAPKVPVLEDAGVLREWPEVAILCLSGDEGSDDVGHLHEQPRIVAHPQSLHGGDEIFADELPGPRHELRDRLAVAHLEHLQDARIRLGHAQEPVVYIGFDPLAHRAGKPEPAVRQRIELDGPGFGRRLRQRAGCRGQESKCQNSHGVIEMFSESRVVGP